MQNLILENKIPIFVKHVSQTLEDANFETYLVGGCVRDMLIGNEPKDFDLATRSVPDEIINLFPKTVYENNFGTVFVINQDSSTDTLSSSSLPTDLPSHSSSERVSVSPRLETSSVEVTPFRQEGKYTDKRHPDNVTFSDNINDDLSRRDFTINAMAYRIKNGELVDLYNGKIDLQNKIIRTVGDADTRFNEDPLRLMRAIRFATQLGFAIEAETMNSIIKNANLIKHISNERIRDEFVKIINSSSPAMGVEMLRRFGLLEYIIPELLEGVGCLQGGAHKYDVYNHLLQALQHAADKDFPFHIRLSALFHDIGKPRTKREPVGKGSTNTLSSSSLPTDLPSRSSSKRVFVAPKSKPTFYGHEVVGAKMAKKIMERLKFSRNEIDLVYKMVRYHMFFSDTEVITLSPVRRMIQNVGVDHIWELMQIRECDRVGMDKTEAPYRLRKYHAMIEQALRDPISVKQLKINGEDLMNTCKIKPGPRMGWMLNALLEEVLDDPQKNTQEYLFSRVGDLDKLDNKELKILGEQAKDKKEELEEQEISKLHAKHKVKK